MVATVGVDLALDALRLWCCLPDVGGACACVCKCLIRVGD